MLHMRIHTACALVQSPVRKRPCTPLTLLAPSTCLLAAPTHGPAVMGNADLKQGTLSQSRKTPAFTFGSRHPRGAEAGPGPQDYNAGWASTMPAHPAPGWGPPPGRRPASAPRPLRPDERLAAKPAKGPSFGLAHAKDKNTGARLGQPCLQHYQHAAKGWHLLVRAQQALRVSRVLSVADAEGCDPATLHVSSAVPSGAFHQVRLCGC
jgi:hypothetical protein